MIVTHNSLHSSGRALLTRPALAAGDDAHSPQGIRMANLWVGQPLVHQRFQSFPAHPMSLAPAPQCMVPVPANLVAEQVQSRLIRLHSIVPVEPVDHGPEQLPLPSYWFIHSSLQLSFGRLHRPAHPVSRARDPPFGKVSDRSTAKIAQSNLRRYPLLAFQLCDCIRPMDALSAKKRRMPG